MNGTPVVEIAHLRFAYENVTVLEDVNVTVPPGDWVAIVGPNGGGKTTLVKLMLGLLEPTAGAVRLLGDLPARTRSRVGYVPQARELDHTFPATVMDVVRMGRLETGWPRHASAHRRQETLERRLAQVGLDGLARRPFGSLSGGQRQRVLIARALACEPEVLVLDEPTAHVDAVAERELQSLLADLGRRTTIIIVTHDVAFVSGCVRTVLCVNRQVVQHPTSELAAIDAGFWTRVYGADVRAVRHDETCRGDR